MHINNQSSQRSSYFLGQNLKQKQPHLTTFIYLKSPLALLNFLTTYISLPPLPPPTPLHSRIRMNIEYMYFHIQDYVTEKFFNILPYNVIPVVFNGANMSAIAPPHSYINAEDFSSVEQLAEYLKLVARNDSLFASYFWWRDYYKEEFCDHKIVCHKKSFQQVLLFNNLPQHCNSNSLMNSGMTKP